MTKKQQQHEQKTDTANCYMAQAHSQHKQTNVNKKPAMMVRLAMNSLLFGYMELLTTQRQEQYWKGDVHESSFISTGEKKVNVFKLHVPNCFNFLTVKGEHSLSSLKAG